MDETPCKDCITLPICRNVYNTGDIFRIRRLTRRCSILKEFLTAETLEEYIELSTRVKEYMLWC
jgi:hypothetical protein